MEQAGGHTKKIQVGIVGGAGYTGGELIRLLINHPLAHIQFIHSKSNAGQAVHKVHNDLLGETDLILQMHYRMILMCFFMCRTW